MSARGERDECFGSLTPLRVGDRDHRAFEHSGVGGDDLLDLDRRDVLAAGDDDVLLAVADLDVAVGMHDPDVSGVEPAAVERRRGRSGIVEVPGHHVVAAHHHLAHRLAIAGHVLHPRVDDADRIGDDVDRKSTRLNSSHTVISYAVFCLKKKKKKKLEYFINQKNKFYNY